MRDLSRVGAAVVVSALGLAAGCGGSADEGATGSTTTTSPYVPVADRSTVRCAEDREPIEIEFTFEGKTKLTKASKTDDKPEVVLTGAAEGTAPDAAASGE